MDAAEYKHIVLGLIFLKYISDTFDIQKNKIKQMVSDKKSDLFISEDPKVYEKELKIEIIILKIMFFGFLKKQDGKK